MMFQDIKDKMNEYIKQGSCGYNIPDTEGLAEKVNNATNVMLDVANKGLMDSGLYDVEKFEFSFETSEDDVYFTIRLGMYICVADMQDEGRHLLDLIECGDSFSIYSGEITSDDGEKKNMICMELHFNCRR